jgi:hypothetical protein
MVMALLKYPFATRIMTIRFNTVGSKPVTFDWGEVIEVLYAAIDSSATSGTHVISLLCREDGPRFRYRFERGGYGNLLIGPGSIVLPMGFNNVTACCLICEGEIGNA